MISRQDLARVNVVGTSGSGKSFFSKKLAEKLGHAQIEMDRLFWLPNWTLPKDEDFFRKLEIALAGEYWILDGNYDRTLPIKWARATTVVWIDYSRTRTLLQAIRRAITRSLTREELWPETGNRESFARTFLSKESILLWTWRTHANIIQRYEARMTDPEFSHIKFVRIRSPSEARGFLESV